MTTRTDMSAIILLLRGMCEAGTADYTLAGAAYWTDDQLQDALDRSRIDLNMVQLSATPRYSGGSITYTEYRAPMGYIEGGTALEVVDASGATQGTATYTADAMRGIVNFISDQAGAARYINGRAFDLDKAAAEVWRKKASHYATAYNINADGQNLSRAQLFEHAIEMAREYSGMVRGADVSIGRGDDTW